MVISEVMWMGSDLSTADEWVEIACSGESDCDLSGWTLTTLKSSGEEGTMVCFATGTILPAGAVRVISRYPDASSRLAIEPWISTSSMSLPNTKLLLRLRDAAGSVRDEVDDGVGNPFAGANPSGGPKAGMERVDLSAPGNAADNWRTAFASEGFKEGAPIFGSPGVIFSSSMSSSGEGGSSSEESSSSSLPPPGEGPGMGDSSDASSSSQASLVSSASSSSDSSVSFAESSSGSGSSLSALSSGSSYSSLSSLSSLSSIASLSSLSSPPSVLITEVLANPIGADTDEWIEIGNFGEVPVNIAGWVLDDGNSSAVYRIPPPSGSGFFLAAGEYRSFRKSVTNLPLDNSGERVSLMSGSLLIDAWEYPLTAEEVSFGRDPDPPHALHAFCVPTEGRRNTAELLPARIVIQDAGSAQVGSASVVGEEHVLLNLQAAVGAGSLASAVCTWDFGDDAVSGACNPPSHTFSDSVDYVVRLTVRDFCGGISVSTLFVSVLPEEETVVQASSSSSSSRIASSSSSSCSSSSSATSIVLMSVRPDVRSETGVVLSEIMMTGDEWIELFNPTDHAISLGGWMLDDLKDGGHAPRSSARSGVGSKPFAIPADTQIAAGAYRIFSKSETKISLNDTGDDVWLIAPDDSWSDHISVPKLKAGISFSVCAGEWRATDPTPGLSNECQAVTAASVSSAASSKKSAVVSTSVFSRTRYVLASSSSSLSSNASGALLMSFTGSELPPTLTVAGSASEKSSVPEVGTLGALSGLGVALMWFGRKWWFL